MHFAHEFFILNRHRPCLPYPWVMIELNFLPMFMWLVVVVLCNFEQLEYIPKVLIFKSTKGNFQFRAMHKCCPNDVVLSEIGFWRPSSCLLVVLLTLLTFWRPVLKHTGRLEFNIFTKFFFKEQKCMIWFVFELGDSDGIEIKTTHAKNNFSVLSKREIQTRQNVNKEKSCLVEMLVFQLSFVSLIYHEAKNNFKFPFR